MCVWAGCWSEVVISCFQSVLFSTASVQIPVYLLINSFLAIYFRLRCCGVWAAHWTLNVFFLEKIIYRPVWTKSLILAGDTVTVIWWRVTTKHLPTTAMFVLHDILTQTVMQHGQSISAKRICKYITPLFTACATFAYRHNIWSPMQQGVYHVQLSLQMGHTHTHTQITEQ